MQRSTLLCLAVLNAAGCVPWPVRLAPQVEGVVVRGEAPAVGAPVGLAVGPGDACRTPLRTAATDAAGGFRLAAVRVWTWRRVGAPARGLSAWQLCAPGPGGAWRPAYHVAGAAPADRSYHCRLDLGPLAPVAACTTTAAERRRLARAAGAELPHHVVAPSRARER